MSGCQSLGVMLGCPCHLRLQNDPAAFDNPTQWNSWNSRSDLEAPLQPKKHWDVSLSYMFHDLSLNNHLLSTAITPLVPFLSPWDWISGKGLLLDGPRF